MDAVQERAGILPCPCISIPVMAAGLLIYNVRHLRDSRPAPATKGQRSRNNYHVVYDTTRQLEIWIHHGDSLDTIGGDLNGNTKGRIQLKGRRRRTTPPLPTSWVRAHAIAERHVDYISHTVLRPNIEYCKSMLFRCFAGADLSLGYYQIRRVVRK